jgi:hypothetical protein
MLAMGIRDAARAAQGCLSWLRRGMAAPQPPAEALLLKNQAPSVSKMLLQAPAKWREWALSAAQFQLSERKFEVLPAAPPFGAATGYCCGSGTLPNRSAVLSGVVGRELVN